MEAWLFPRLLFFPLHWFCCCCIFLCQVTTHAFVIGINCILCWELMLWWFSYTNRQRVYTLWACGFLPWLLSRRWLQGTQGNHSSPVNRRRRYHGDAGWVMACMVMRAHHVLYSSALLFYIDSWNTFSSLTFPRGYIKFTNSLHSGISTMFIGLSE